MSVAWQFLLAGLGTYAIRIWAIALVGRGLAIPPRVERTLRLIAPAVLASIVVNSLVLDHDRFSARVSWFAGATLAALIVRRYGAAGWAMLVAMLVVYVLQQLGLR